MLAIGICFIYSFFNVVFAYDVIAVQDGGELSGTIRFNGEIKEPKPFKVDRNAEYCGNTIPDESLIVNAENKGIQNVVVSFEEVSKGKQHEPTDLIINNSKCHFVPRTLAAMIGDFYQVKNSDPIVHNTNLRFEESSVLSIIMEPNGKIIRRPLIKNEGIIYGKCNVHKFMKVSIHVFNHPYFAVTDKNGEFRISEIPPGEYKIKIWHESLPEKESTIKIESHQKSKITLEMSRKK
jgi:polysaccharide lyase family 4-like protein